MFEGNFDILKTKVFKIERVEYFLRVVDDSHSSVGGHGEPTADPGVQMGF